jgi:hypothetical protein
MMYTEKLTVNHANPLECDAHTFGFTKSMARINIVNYLHFSKKITKTSLRQQIRANNQPQKQAL